MPSIDVQVTRGGRAIKVACGRPLRVTPRNRAGIVYKGRVFEVHVDTEDVFYIDASGESWSNDLAVCPLATPIKARQLLKRKQQYKNVGVVGLANSGSGVDTVGGEVSQTKGDSGFRTDGSVGKDNIEEILRLLMPHASSNDVG